MKKLILSTILIFAILFAFSQATVVNDFRITNATTAFGRNLPVGTKVYNIATGDYWVTTAGVASTATLTTGSASFTKINTGSVVSDATYSGSWNGVTTLAPSQNSVYDKISLLENVSYCPATMTVNTGTLSTGTVANLCAVGGTDVDIVEVSGTDPLRVTFTFTSVNRMTNFVFYGNYAGGPGHILNIEIYNPNTTNWDFLGSIGTTTAKQWYSFAIFQPSTYISSGTVQTRIYHLGTGIGTHRLYLDYADVNYGGSGGGTNVEASTVSFAPAGNIVATNVQAAIQELDTEKEPVLTKNNLTETITGLEFSATSQVIGSAVALGLTTGYIIPTTTEQTNWGTAYTNRITSLTTTGSSGAATLSSNTLNIPNYTLAGLGGIGLTSLSSTATGLTYTNTTGVFSLTGGYQIPTTTQVGNIHASGSDNQTLTIGGTTSPTIALSGSNTATFSAGTGVSLNQSAGTITITNSAPNTNQSITNTSDATSHTATLSSSGGSLKLSEGTGIGLATTGTAGDGIVTITNSLPDQTVSFTNGIGISVTGTYPSFTVTNTSPNVTDAADLTFSGAASPYTLNSSTGTDVTFTSGTGISLSGSSSNLTVTNSAPNVTTNLTLTGTVSPYTLESSDGTDVTFTQGTNMTITRNGNDLSFASTGSGGATDLSVTGSSSPLTLNSSTGTDVTFTAGSGITLTGTSGDITITSSAGGGNVSKVATPLDDQVGVWTGDGTIEGDVDLTFNGTKLTTTQLYITTPTAGVGDYDKFLVLDVTGTEVKTRTGAEVASDIGALTAEVDGSVSNEIQNLSYTASTRVLAIDGTGSTDATLPLFSSTEAGLTPLSGGGTTNFLRADGAWAAAGGGTGDVTKVGTPVDNQVGVWTGSGTIEGDADLTFDGNKLTVKDFIATRQYNTVLNGSKSSNWTHDAALGDVGAYLVNLAATTLSIHNLTSGMQGTIFLNFVTTTPTTLTVNTFSDAGSTGLTEVVLGGTPTLAVNKSTSVTYTCASDGTNTYVYLVYGQE